MFKIYHISLELHMIVQVKLFIIIQLLVKVIKQLKVDIYKLCARLIYHYQLIIHH